MNTIGADVDELDALGRSFARESRGLGATVAVIDATVRSSWWQGPSATRFEADWHRAHAATMRTVADLLEHAARDLQAQARQQRTTSDATGSVVAPVGAGFTAALTAIREFALHGWTTTGSAEWSGAAVRAAGQFGSDRNGGSGSVELLGASAVATGTFAAGLSGLDADASLAARADLFRARGELHSTQGNSSLGASESVDGEVSVGAHADASGHVHVGADGVEMSGTARAFVGAEATANAHAEAHWGFLQMKTNAHVSAAYGAGGEVSRTFELTTHGIKFGGSAHGALGLGLGAGGDVELDWTPVTHAVGSLEHATWNAVKHIKLW